MTAERLHCYPFC